MGLPWDARQPADKAARRPGTEAEWAPPKAAGVRADTVAGKVAEREVEPDSHSQDRQQAACPAAASPDTMAARAAGKGMVAGAQQAETKVQLEPEAAALASEQLAGPPADWQRGFGAQPA